MRFEDWVLLGKKIIVGVVITIVPFAILVGGLWFTQGLAGNPSHAKQSSSAKEMSHAN